MKNILYGIKLHYECLESLAFAYCLKEGTWEGTNWFQVTLLFWALSLKPRFMAISFSDTSGDHCLLYFPFFLWVVYQFYAIYNLLINFEWKGCDFL